MSIPRCTAVCSRARAIVAALAAALALSCHAHVATMAYVGWHAPTPAIVLRDDEEPYCLDTFEPALAPYGTWIDDEVYGFVWIPSPTLVGSGFTPYLSGGRWAYTSEGYVFVSEYSWGWVTYHYGRWVHSTVHGWAWVPGARYAPAWVEWRYGGGHIGWAPVRPTWRWRLRVAYVVVAPPAPFVFVSTKAFFSPHLSVYVAPPSMHAAMHATTTRWIAPPAATFGGPPPELVGIPRSHTVHATVVPAPHIKAVPWGRSLVIR